MIAYGIKRKGARTYDARIGLDFEPRMTQVPLGCTNRQVADKKLAELAPDASTGSARSCAASHAESHDANGARYSSNLRTAAVLTRVSSMVRHT
jgi:hypothetical protein